MKRESRTWTQRVGGKEPGEISPIFGLNMLRNLGPAAVLNIMALSLVGCISNANRASNIPANNASRTGNAIVATPIDWEAEYFPKTDKPYNPRDSYRGRPVGSYTDTNGREHLVSISGNNDVIDVVLPQLEPEWNWAPHLDEQKETELTNGEKLLITAMTWPIGGAAIKILGGAGKAGAAANTARAGAASRTATATRSSATGTAAGVATATDRATDIDSILRNLETASSMGR